MYLKGQAHIILKDPKTGRIVHEETHSNNITPALARIFGDNLAGTLDYTKIMPVLNKAIGGVCLFNGTVNANDIFLPKATSATLTAHAGQRDGSTGQDPKRGNPNPLQSGPVQNGFMWVWDWTTKGNGTITDVVLTHADTGDFWNESTPNDMQRRGTPGAANYNAGFEPVGDLCVHNLPSNDFLYVADGDYSNTPQITNAKRIPIAFLDDVNNVLSVEVDYTNHRLNVYKSKFTGSGAWIWNECGEIYEQSEPIPFRASPFEWGSWERLGRAMFYLAFDRDNNKLHALAIGRGGSSYLNNWMGKWIYLNTLDLTTGTMTDAQINLTDYLPDRAFVAMWGAFPEGTPLLLKMVNGSVFIPVVDDNSQFAFYSVRVNLTDYTDVEMVDGLYPTTGANQWGIPGVVNLGNDRTLYGDKIATRDSSGNFKGFSCYRDNGADGSVFGPDDLNDRIFVCEQPTPSPVQYMTRTKNGTLEGDYSPPRGCVLNKLYAATVYHLEQPVVKTASLTMTVEYTITQETGAES